MRRRAGLAKKVAVLSVYYAASLAWTLRLLDFKIAADLLGQEIVYLAMAWNGSRFSRCAIDED
jgi:hypothetical protein